MSTERREKEIKFTKQMMEKGSKYTKRASLILALISGMILCSGSFPEWAQMAIRVIFGGAIFAVSFSIARIRDSFRTRIREFLEKESLSFDEFIEIIVDGKYKPKTEK